MIVLSLEVTSDFSTICVQNAVMKADCIELRVTKSQIPQLIDILTTTAFSIPLIITFIYSSFQNMKEYFESFSLLPYSIIEYVDIDILLDHDLYTQLYKKIKRDVKIIHSIHAHNTLPTSSVTRLYSRPATVYKVCVYTSSLHVLSKVLHLQKIHRATTVMTLGPFSVISRVIAKKYGASLTYCAPEGMSVVKTQPSIDLLINRYAIASMTSNTELYALFGSNLSVSPSFHTHNALLEEYNLNKRYIPIEVKEQESDGILQFINDFEILGSSWTMPFKSFIATKCKNVKSPVMAINTTYMNQGELIGVNTDYIALKSMIHKCHQRNKCLIIGSGSTAETAIASCKNSGIDCYVYARNAIKANALVKKYQLSCVEKPAHFNVVIITIPSTDGFDIWEKVLSTDCVIDVRLQQSSKESVFALKKWGATLFNGYDMFVIQAAHQWFTWCSLEVAASEKILRKHILVYLENR